MKSAKITAAALLTCALALPACKPKPEPVIEVRPVVCQCPKPATPPPELMQRPTVEHFLPQT